MTSWQRFSSLPASVSLILELASLSKLDKKPELNRCLFARLLPGYTNDRMIDS